MIIVDSALAKRAEEKSPLQVGLFGAGFMAKGIVNQVTRYTPGMRIAVICNRTLAAARKTYEVAGIDASDVVECETSDQVDDAIRNGKYAITSSVDAVNASAGVEIVIESTGHVEYGAKFTDDWRAPTTFTATSQSTSRAEWSRSTSVQS